MPNNNEEYPKKPEQFSPEERIKELLQNRFEMGSRVKRLNSKDEIVEDAVIIGASQKTDYVRLELDRGVKIEVPAGDILEWNEESGNAENDRQADSGLESIGEYKKGDTVMVLEVGELTGNLSYFTNEREAYISFPEDPSKNGVYSLEKIYILEADKFQEADQDITRENLHFSEKELEGRPEAEKEKIEVDGAEKIFSSTLLDMENAESGFFKKIKKGVAGFFSREKGESDTNPEIEKFIKDADEEVKKMASENSSEEKRNILRGVVSLGLGARQYKNEFMAKAFGMLVAEKGDKDDWSKGENAGALTRFLQKYSENYHRDALKAKQNREDLYKPGGWLKRAATYGSGVGSLIGNGALIARLITGFGYNPLRTVGAAALVVGRTGEVLKDVNLNRLSKETRIQDVDEAMEMAYALYEDAKSKSVDGKVSKNDLEKVYIKNLPEEILEKLSAKPEVGKFAAVPEWIAKKEIGFSLGRLEEKLKAVESDNSLSDKEKEKAMDEIRLKYSKFLREMELMVENGGKVDMMAYSSRVMEQVGKKTALIMMIETLAEGVVKAGEVGWAAASKAFESWDKSGGVSPEAMEAIKRSVSLDMTKVMGESESSNITEDDSLPDNKYVEDTYVPPSAVTAGPVKDAISNLQPKDGKLEKVFDERIMEERAAAKMSSAEQYDKLLYEDRMQSGLPKDFPNQKGALLPEQELSAEKYDQILYEEKKMAEREGVVGWKMPEEKVVGVEETSVEERGVELEPKSSEAKSQLARDFYFREQANKFEPGDKVTVETEAGSELDVAADRIPSGETEIPKTTAEVLTEEKAVAGTQESILLSKELLHTDKKYVVEEKLNADVRKIFETEVFHRKGFAEEQWLETKGDEAKTFLSQIEDYRKNSQGRIIESLPIKRHLRLEEYIKNLEAETNTEPQTGETIEQYLERALSEKMAKETLTLPETQQVELKDLPIEDQKLYTKEVKIPVKENVFAEPETAQIPEKPPVAETLAEKTGPNLSALPESQFIEMAKAEAAEDIKNIYHIRWYDRHGAGDWKDAKEQNAKMFMGVVERFMPGTDHSQNASFAYHKKLLSHLNKLMTETGLSPKEDEKVEDFLNRLTAAEIKKINGVGTGQVLDKVLPVDEAKAAPTEGFVERNDVISTEDGKKIEISREDETRWMQEGREALLKENKPVEGFVDRADVIETENGPVEISREDEIRWMEEAKRQILDSSESKKPMEGGIPVAPKDEPKVISAAVEESERLGLSAELEKMSKSAVDEELDKLYTKTNIFGKVTKESGENSPYWKHVKDTPMENFQRFYDRYGLDKAPITPFKNEENEVQYKLYQRLKRLHQESGLKIEANETVSQYMHRAMKHLLANMHHSQRINQ